ncbi:MAG: type VI secretion system baseplate subunit TssG [Alphaproteobacteria bacterium]|nr:type VI secretion system baseplate subunit TssG [Alphaproteobacteria bacterium]
MEDVGKLVKQASRRLRTGTGAPDFFELVRRIGHGRPDLPRLGKAARPTQENVRFGQTPYLHFPPTEVAEIRQGNGSAEALIMTYFFGLLGVNGPMPLEFTDYVFQRSHNYYDQTWRRFLDIINHRFLTLFYRAWAENEQAVSFDRADDDKITDIVRALAGTPSDMSSVNRTFPYLTANYANHFGRSVKSCSSLEEILRNVMKVDLVVKDFVVSSYDIPKNARCHLGHRESSVLGKNIQLGRTYMSATREFEIEVGPVSFAECCKWAPGRKGFDVINRIVTAYLDRPLEYSLTFIVIGKTIPEVRFEGKDKGVRLGQGFLIGRLKDNENTKITIKASRIYAKNHKASFQQQEKNLWQN